MKNHSWIGFMVCWCVCVCVCVIERRETMPREVVQPPGPLPEEGVVVPGGGLVDCEAARGNGKFLVSDVQDGPWPDRKLPEESMVGISVPPIPISLS